MSRTFCLTSIIFAWVGISCFSQAANADVFDLKSDFSNAVNPNGVWSFTQGFSVLTHYPQPGDGNALNTAAANGFWGVGPSFNSNVPFVLQVTQDGSAVPGLTDDDFLLDDVIVHSSNAGLELFINWTAPSDGSVDNYSGSIWYAHSNVTRINDFAVQLNGGAALNSGTVTNGQGKSNAVGFNDAGALSVSAGDVLSISLFRDTGQPFGSLAGVDFTVNFTSAVPERLGS
jgi:hypothetical protein